MSDYRRLRWVAIANNILILISIALLVVEAKFPSSYARHEPLFWLADLSILVLFVVDYMLRLISRDGGWKYALSWYGLIDLVATLPSVLLVAIDLGGTLTWLRTLRLLRLGKVFSQMGGKNVYYGIFAQISPYVLTVLALKCVAIAYEDQKWWPVLDDINTTIGVLGFAVAVAIGAKLSVVSARLYAIEDAICRIVGCARDLEHRGQIRLEISDWACCLEDALKAPWEEKHERARSMRLMTDKLSKAFAREGILGPSTTGFHRDVAFLLHRMTATTPPSFDRFLLVMTVIYALTQVAIVPGLTGLLSSVLVSLGLGGLFQIVRDMDDPLCYDETSLIDVRMDALTQFNEIRKES